MLTMYVAAMIAATAQPAPEVVVPPPIEGAPAAEPSEAAIAEAAKMFEGESFRDQLIAGIMVGINQGIEDEIAAGGAEALDDAASARIQEALVAEFSTVIDAELAAFRRAAAIAYARYFSLDELRELNELMQRPVFRKMDRLAAIMGVEMMQASQRLFEPHMPALIERAAEIALEILAERTGRSRS